ncbi:MAG: NTP transferase domain-containing protein [Fidelibacterota bacterium]
MTRPRALGVIILAAGEGRRMKSSLPKVLHRVGDRPMIHHVLHTAQSLDPEKIVVVVGNRKDRVKQALNDPRIAFVKQDRQQGTGHAVLQARSEFEGFDGDILILSGDVPLLSEMSLDKLLSTHYVSKAAATYMTVIFDNPSGYGRVIKNGQGDLFRIVEDKDCSPEQKDIREVNAGVYVFDAALLFRYLPQLSNMNAQREYYLPDVQEFMRSAGHPVALYSVSDAREVAGVNSPEQLAQVRRIYEELHEDK